MAKRYETNARMDKKIFATTANSKKRITLEPMRMRGGIRL